MYSYRATSGTIFHYNSDFSGDIIITRITKRGEDKGETIDREIGIPGKDILEFVAYGYIMPENIAAIEDKNWKELLGIKEA